MTDKISPRLGHALRAVGGNRELFEEAYRTKTAPELERDYGLNPYDITLLRQHWQLELKAPMRSHRTPAPAPQALDSDEVALKVGELVAPKLEEIERRLNQMAGTLRRIEEKLPPPPPGRISSTPLVQP